MEEVDPVRAVTKRRSPRKTLTEEAGGFHAANIVVTVGVLGPAVVAICEVIRLADDPAVPNQYRTGPRACSVSMQKHALGGAR